MEPACCPSASLPVPSWNVYCILLSVSRESEVQMRPSLLLSPGKSLLCLKVHIQSPGSGQGICPYWFHAFKHELWTATVAVLPLNVFMIWYVSYVDNNSMAPNKPYDPGSQTEHRLTIYLNERLGWQGDGGSQLSSTCSSGLHKYLGGPIIILAQGPTIRGREGPRVAWPALLKV